MKLLSSIPGLYFDRLREIAPEQFVTPVFKGLVCVDWKLEEPLDPAVSSWNEMDEWMPTI